MTLIIQIFPTEMLHDPDDDSDDDCLKCSSVPPIVLTQPSGTNNTIVINANPVNMIVVEGPTVSTVVEQTGSNFNFSFFFLSR